jgi:hypothetical protein
VETDLITGAEKEVLNKTTKNKMEKQNFFMVRLICFFRVAKEIS